MLKNCTREVVSKHLMTIPSTCRAEAEVEDHRETKTEASMLARLQSRRRGCICHVSQTTEAANLFHQGPTWCDTILQKCLLPNNSAPKEGEKNKKKKWLYTTISKTAKVHTDGQERRKEGRAHTDGTYACNLHRHDGFLS